MMYYILYKESKSISYEKINKIWPWIINSTFIFKCIYDTNFFQTDFGSLIDKFNS